MASPVLPPNRNRAGEVHAFTWTLEIISLAFVVGRMYSRVKLTRNVWWDDWCVCIALLFDFVISIMWSVYAGRGYARHIEYLNPAQLSDALELNTISRSLCIFSIAVGKISVAFLIERLAGPSKIRKWILRSISISVFVSAMITILLFYVQCQPARALWDKGMIKEGTGSCWNPIPVNTWDLVIASYWAFLDFALAFIPIDMVWKLQMNRQKKFWLSCLLGMGVFAGIAAAVKTSKVPITVKAADSDITWQTVELLMWNGIEMNVIIIAACIPTLRPVFLILFKRPGASKFRSNRNRRHSSYKQTGDSNDSKPLTIGSSGATKAFPNAPANSKWSDTNTTSTANTTIHISSRECESQDNESAEREWGLTRETSMPLREFDEPGKEHVVNQ